jgi:hypothetical protein
MGRVEYFLSVNTITQDQYYASVGETLVFEGKFQAVGPSPFDAIGDRSSAL